MSTCPRCGTQITGFENTCPTCGAPISLAQQPQPQPVPIDPNAVAAVAQPASVTDSTTMGQQPVQVGSGQMVGQQVVTAEQIKQNKKDAKKQKKQKVKEKKEKQVDPNKPAKSGLNKEITPKQATMVIFVLAIILIIVGVVMTLTSSKSTANPKNDTEKTTTQENPITDGTTTTEDVTSNETLYAGYSFNAPEGYQTEENNEYGLVFNNGEVAITIMIDATNSFDTYKSEFTTKFPGQASTLEKTVGERNYINIKHLTSEQTLKGIEYISPANDNYSFVGLIVRNDGLEADDSNYQVLNNILDNATSTDGTIKAGDDLDAGKLGTKIFNIDLTKFNF